MAKYKFHTKPKELKKSEILDQDKEKKLDEWMESAGGDEIKKTSSLENKKRIEQHRKGVYMDDTLHNAWIEYQTKYWRTTGNKISFQEFIEKYLRRVLKEYM